MKKTYTITYTLNGNVAIHSITSEDGTKPTRAEATRALSFFLIERQENWLFCQ